MVAVVAALALSSGPRSPASAKGRDGAAPGTSPPRPDVKLEPPPDLHAPCAAVPNKTVLACFFDDHIFPDSANIYVFLTKK